MKILHISNYYPPHIGGIEKVAGDVVRSLLGFAEQKVICFAFGRESSVDIYSDVEVRRIGFFAKKSSQPLSFSYRGQLANLIREFKPDFIHFHHPNPFVSVLLMSIKHNAKIIVHYHLDITKQKFLKILYRPLQDRLLKMAHKIVVTSKKYMEFSTDLKNYINKCVIIPNCVDESKLVLTAQNLKNIELIKAKFGNNFKCFFLGRHIPYKGLSNLIKVAKILDKEYVFLIGGDGELTESLKKSAEGLDNVIFLGVLNEEESKEYLFASDIFVFPSITKNEAFGISLAEALYCGKPAVTFTIDGSGVNWVNLKGITGEEVKNGDFKAYAEAIEKLKNNPNLLAKYSKNAIEHIRNNMMFSSIKKSVLNLYDIKFP